MLHSTYTLIPLAALVSYAVLFLVVVFNKPLTASRKSFAVYLLAMAVWSLAALLLRVYENSLLFWFRLMVSSALASMLALFQFVQDVLFRKYRFSLAIYFYSLAAMLLAQFTPLVAVSAGIIDDILVYEFSPWIGLIAGPGYLLMVFNMVVLYRAYHTSGDITQRNRFKMLLLAIGIKIIGSTVNFTNLGKYPIDIAANLVSAGLITYTVLKHKLLDITVIIRKSLLYALPTMALGAGYFLIISVAINIFNIFSGVRLVSLSVIVAMLSALIAEPFRKVLQDRIDRLFFREHYNALIMLQRIGKTASAEMDLTRLTRNILEEISSTMHVSRTAIFLRANGNNVYSLISQTGKPLPPRTAIAKDHPIIHHLTNCDDVLTSQNIDVLPSFKSMWSEEKNLLESLSTALFVPMKSGGKLIGLISLGMKQSEQFFTNEDIQTLTALSNQIAVAVQNAQLFSTAQQELFQRRETENRLHLQLKRLSALQNINMAITTNIDLQIPLFLLLEQVTEELDVDAADVLLMDDYNQRLVFVAGRGFLTEALKFTHLDVGHGLAGQAAETMKVIHINDLRREATSLSQSPEFKDEGFVAYFGVPLISKGKVQGVLELFHRSPLNPDEDWMKFLETLTSETAIAVDNAQMFRDLEKSNQDLALAYETTLEGWAKTLELRDRETEGHSQRVLDLTMRLANKLGVNEAEIVHVHRGAILHDIGKMGIPDHILLKNGPLEDEEWEEMRKHPIYAHEMLSSIPFLKNATDIPYCHHEKWDGSGYPRGLKGEEIPLAARIFAIIDVWDALRSDRPYRPAWSDQEAIDYIRDQSGIHFDPMVVKAFLEVLGLERRRKRSSFRSGSTSVHQEEKQ